MSNPFKRFYEFGHFRVDAPNRLLLKGGEPLPLAPKAVETLLVLLGRGGEVVTKDELLRLVWPDCAVEEGNLTQNIYLLRKTLGEGAGGQRYIETVPRRGYRFVGEARESGAGFSGAAAHGRAEVLALKEGGAEDEGDVAWAAAPPRGHAPPPPAFKRRRRATTFGLLAAALCVSAGLLYLIPKGVRGPAETKPAIRTIAVLPFKPLGAGGGDEELGAGVADALITQLSNARQLVVRPTDAVLRYEGADEELTAVGRELGVDALVVGRFQRAGNRLRVTVQLVEARGGAPLWADKFDEESADVLAAQDSVARRVASALMLRLTGEEQRLLAKRFTENPEAYQAYLRGRYYWGRRETNALREAVKYFEQALRYDPDYAPAYAGLAGAYATLGSHFDAEGEGDAAAFPKAKAAAERALQLNDLLAEAHTALGVVRSRYDWDFEGAEREFRRAVELNPNYAHAHLAYALHLSAVGRAAEAEAEMRRAQELDPLSFPAGRGLGQILFHARRYDEAVEQFRRTLRLSPDDPMAPALHRALGWAYEYQGDHERAFAEFTESVRLREKPADEVLAALRRAYEAGGVRGYWREWLAQRAGTIARGGVNPFLLAQVYAFLGENVQALAYLQSACEDRSVPLAALLFGPHFDGLRADPRYAALLRRNGLAAAGPS